MNRLTATVITLNEEHNLPCALASLEDIPDEIVLVDSGSTDRTCEIGRQRGAAVFSRAWTGYSDQKNFAAARAKNDWILSLDADEELSPELRESLRVWKHAPPAAAVYECARKAWYLGAWIEHSGWYPDYKKRLYRRDAARFAGHLHESLDYAGPVGRLRGDLHHYTVQSFEEHVTSVNRYTTLAAEQLFAAGHRRWRLAMLLAPPWGWVQTFMIRGGFLDGRRGWLIARMAARYTYLKYRKLGRLVEGQPVAARQGSARGGSRTHTTR